MLQLGRSLDSEVFHDLASDALLFVALIPLGFARDFGNIWQARGTRGHVLVSQNPISQNAGVGRWSKSPL